MSSNLALIIAAFISGPIAIAVAKWWERRKDKVLIEQGEAAVDAQHAAQARKDFDALSEAQQNFIRSLLTVQKQRDEEHLAEQKRREEECDRRIGAIEEKAERDKLELLDRIVYLEGQLPIPEG